jgi:hypothetical protein
VREVRRDIARMMTIAKQKRAGSAPAAKPAAAKTERKAVKRTAKPRPPVSNRTKPRLASRAKAKRK